MPYVTFESMEHEGTTNLAEKSTILDGRRRRRWNVEVKPLSPQVGDGVGDRLGAVLGKSYQKF